MHTIFRTKIEWLVTRYVSITNKMSMYSRLSITMRFIRNDSEGKPNTDDTLRIRKNLTTGDFDIKYKDANDGVSTKTHGQVLHTMVGLGHARVLRHVYLLMKNQYLDVQGFSQIQIDVPAMPRILLDASSMSDLYYREHVCELIAAAMENLENGEFTLDDTYTSTLRSYNRARQTDAVPEYTGRHTFYDE